MYHDSSLSIFVNHLKFDCNTQEHNSLHRKYFTRILNILASIKTCQTDFYYITNFYNITYLKYLIYVSPQWLLPPPPLQTVLHKNVTKSTSGQPPYISKNAYRTDTNKWIYILSTDFQTLLEKCWNKGEKQTNIIRLHILQLSWHVGYVLA